MWIIQPDLIKKRQFKLHAAWAELISIFISLMHFIDKKRVIPQFVHI